jgi:TRAP transporter 4TM/12TM fusion protein
LRREAGGAQARSALERTLLGLTTLSGALWALEVQDVLPFALFKEQYLGLFLGLALAAVFVSVKARAGESGHRVPWADRGLAVAAGVVGGYVAVLYPRLAYALGVLTWDKLVLGVLAVGLVLEATRRLAGWALVWVAVAAVLYARFAGLLPEPLAAKGSSWQRLVVYLYLDANGLLGVPLNVTASVVVAFILFGAALYAVGGDRFLTEVALLAMGRFRGGPAKVAVVSSTLFGTVSGSAVSNVAIDGAITIPMMKRAGYPPHLAAAIEAVASNGGQIMPPVMGAAAFLIAEYLGVPYGRVALAALVPALLYYLALFVQVDLEAARYGLAGLPASTLPRAGQVIRRGGLFVAPLGVLVYTLMVAGWEPGKAGMAAVFATFAAAAVRRESRPGPAAVAQVFVDAGRTLLDLVAITALAGLVIGALQLSGFTSRLPMVLLGIAGQSTPALLVLTALVSIVLGMSLPTTVVYVTLAVLIGPALTELGVAPLAGHLFLFYFGMLSLITPPDCLATYTAAAIARADFWRTGWAGMRLGIVAYLVPFFFVFHPALLFEGPPAEVLLAAVTAGFGVVLLGIGCVGFLVRPLGWGAPGHARPGRPAPVPASRRLGRAGRQRDRRALRRRRRVNRVVAGAAPGPCGASGRRRARRP